MSKTYSAGIVTAYGAAKRAGYTGTYEDFCRQQAGYAENAAAVEQAKTDAINAKNDAVTAKNTAVSAKDDAVSAKNTAVSAKDDAVSAKNTASTKAQEASASATSAGLSATSAGRSATDAEQSAQSVSASVQQIATNTADISQLKADLSDDESILYALSGVQYTIPKTNKRIVLEGLAVGDTVDLTPVSAVNYGYIIIPCASGEEFLISANAGSRKVPWAFIDSNNAVLEIETTYLIKAKAITAPANTSALVVTCNVNAGYYLRRGANVANKLNGEYTPIGLSVVNGDISANGAESSASSYRRTPNAMLLKAGQTIKVNCGCGPGKAVFSEWTSDNGFVQTLVEGKGTGLVDYEYNAPYDMLVKVSYYNSNGYSAYIKYPTAIDASVRASNNELAIDAQMYEWERVLNSVCCIGDSLTRGAYFVNGRDGSAIDQNYPYFFGKQTGLTVQNEGLGGSSPSSRWSYFSTYDFTPYNAFLIWWGTNGGLTDTLLEDGVIDSEGNLIADYSQYADTNTGDYCKVIGKIISQVPHAKIFLGTIFTTPATGGASATNAVIEKIAELYPDNVMGVVDNNDGTLYTLARRKLTPSWVHVDNITHFSMMGNYYLAVHWIKAIRAIIAENPARFEDIMEDILA